MKYSGCRYLKALVCPAENISCSLAATGAENADEHSINCKIFFFETISSCCGAIVHQKHKFFSGIGNAPDTIKCGLAVRKTRTEFIRRKAQL